MSGQLIAEVYPGLFNGSEMLNAVELTNHGLEVMGALPTL
jgi:hypothetical protein